MRLPPTFALTLLPETTAPASVVLLPLCRLSVLPAVICVLVYVVLLPLPEPLPLLADTPPPVGTPAMLKLMVALELLLLWLEDSDWVFLLASKWMLSVADRETLLLALTVLP